MTENEARTEQRRRQRGQIARIMRTINCLECGFRMVELFAESRISVGVVEVQNRCRFMRRVIIEV